MRIPGDAKNLNFMWAYFTYIAGTLLGYRYRLQWQRFEHL